MTIKCAWCKTRLSERCPKCNSNRVTIEPTLVRGEPARASCGACHAVFREGEGGQSHGICEACRAKARDGGLPPMPGRIEAAWRRELSIAINVLCVRESVSKGWLWAQLVTVVNDPETEKRMGIEI